MKESQLFVGLSRERGHTMVVTVEREGGHGGRSSGAANDVVVCGEVRQASHFQAVFWRVYYLALSSEKDTSNFISRLEILLQKLRFYRKNHDNISKLTILSKF